MQIPARITANTLASALRPALLARADDAMQHPAMPLPMFGSSYLGALSAEFLNTRARLAEKEVQSSYSVNSHDRCSYPVRSPSPSRSSVSDCVLADDDAGRGAEAAARFPVPVRA